MDDYSTPVVRVSLEGVSLGRKADLARWLQDNNIYYRYVNMPHEGFVTYFEMNAGDAILFRLRCDL